MKGKSKKYLWCYLFQSKIFANKQQKLNPVRPDFFPAVKVHIGAFCFRTPPSPVDGTGVPEAHTASNVALSLLHAVRFTCCGQAFSGLPLPLKCTPV